MQCQENAQGDKTPLKTFMKISVILVQLRKKIKKVPLLIRLPKQVIILVFFPIFPFFIFPANISDFFLSLLPFERF